VYERAKQAQTVHHVVEPPTTNASSMPFAPSAGKPYDPRRSPHRHRAHRRSGRARGGDVFVNVQGDEPLVDPVAIDAAVASLLEELPPRLPP